MAQAVPVKPWKVTLSPGTQVLGGSRISTFSGLLAHMTIASDVTPRILVEGGREGEGVGERERERVHVKKHREKVTHTHTHTHNPLHRFEITKDHHQPVLHLLHGYVFH